ncbi:UvrD-helicase domain-containing protein [Robbsia sp. Bb-Pol-6]|uniref:DNA 3'-5' helicase n=2 Tax=Robbsia betulipollinis TaxID=2981849 RepID=A0ABT3ZUH8_9BURK|nr:UvrD-helicase domain-containing protein [Robbsia betulipollinis]MCY0389912.1 UvrD-helicase domain-containing protein [Robbsia betulipollinis]
MTAEWRPTRWGRIFSRAPAWRLCLNGAEIELTIGGRAHQITITDESTLTVQPGLIWSSVSLPAQLPTATILRGIPNTKALAMKSALDAMVADQRLRRNIQAVKTEYSKLHGWLTIVGTELSSAADQCRWITHETQQRLHLRRPVIDVFSIKKLLKEAEVRTGLIGMVENIEKALKQWNYDWPSFWDSVNERYVQKELIASKDLFDKVESKPLTEEQSRAVICFDNRVQVVAAAGSGKTSTMVAKAAYAIQRGFVAPERIVLMAFNKKAAVELKERAERSFKRLGMDGISVEASTFHAVGLSIIGKATGRKPDIPEWATDAAGGVRKLTEIALHLKDTADAFAQKWDLFRFVFARPLPGFGARASGDGWNEAGSAYILTINKDRVRSEEEASIANWLFLNGIDYHYEQPYEVNTATETHRQYKPDFYYPAAKLYHEHFALDANGKAPTEFVDYIDGVFWKRSLHLQHNTELIETTSDMLRSGIWIEHLSRELTKRGIVPNPNPFREIPKGGQGPMEDRALIELMRTFIGHAKSNGLTIEKLIARLDNLPKDSSLLRYRMFLDLVGPVLHAWDEALAHEDGIDFEDMLNRAAEHLEQGHYEAPYDLVMADEFQDASRARARLCRAMVQKKDRYLFAVGDDWQSINRFAGADVSVMTGFKDWFGHGQVLKLEQTFRCPQPLCDVSSGFVSENPAQIPKAIRSVTPTIGPVLLAFQVNDANKLQSAVDQYLDRIVKGLRDQTVPTGRDGKVTVMILGRYNADRAYMPDRWQSRYGQYLDLSFLTIHRSKGSEADYIILPSMLSKLRGNSFPNTRVDDPLLALAMPNSDDFPLGEERRLFYVALTRARRTVALLTVRGQRSAFLDELMKQEAVTLTDVDGKPIADRSCPACKTGAIVTKTGPYGEFESCSNYPSCEYKPKKKNKNDPATKWPAVNDQKVETIASRGAAFTMSPRTASTHTRPAPPPKPETGAQGGLTSSRTKPRGFFDSVLKTGLDLDDYVTLNVDRDKATKDVEAALAREKVIIDIAMEGAKSKIKIQDFIGESSETAALYKENFERHEKLFDTGKQSKPIGIEPLPISFRLSSQHRNPIIEEAIQRKLVTLKNDREAYLSAIHVSLRYDPQLLRFFKEELHAIDGDVCLDAIDPTNVIH